MEYLRQVYILLVANGPYACSSAVNSILLPNKKLFKVNNNIQTHQSTTYRRLLFTFALGEESIESENQLVVAPEEVLYPLNHSWGIYPGISFIYI